MTVETGEVLVSEPGSLVVQATPVSNVDERKTSEKVELAEPVNAEKTANVLESVESVEVIHGELVLTEAMTATTKSLAVETEMVPVGSLAPKPDVEVEATTVPEHSLAKDLKTELKITVAAVNQESIEVTVETETLSLIHI